MPVRVDRDGADVPLVCVSWSPNLDRWYAQLLGSDACWFGMTPAEAALACIVGTYFDGVEVDVAIRDEWNRDFAFLDCDAHKEANVASFGPRVRPGTGPRR